MASRGQVLARDDGRIGNESQARLLDLRFSRLYMPFGKKYCLNKSYFII